MQRGSLASFFHESRRKVPGRPETSEVEANLNVRNLTPDYDIPRVTLARGLAS